MIRIDRGAEPDTLRRARYVHLARAILANTAGTSPRVDDGYESARDPLHRAQNLKCAYCEMQQQVSSQPAEHFRPKAKAIRGDGSEAPGYWWLAWTWNNLFFACGTCNGASRKANHFGLESGSVPLSPFQSPPSQEVSSFIDPSREEPIDHIEFKRLGRHWRPIARAGSPRGHYTIKKLGLDRGPLLDFYNGHVRGTVQPELDRIRAALSCADLKKVSRVWSRCLRVLFGDFVHFQGLSYDVLDAALPDSERQRWRLTLPRPGRHAEPQPTIEHEPPGLAVLSASLALEVRALGPSPGKARLPVLRAVRDAHPDWTPSELADLFEVTEQTITNDLRATTRR